MDINIWKKLWCAKRCNKNTPTIIYKIKTDSHSYLNEADKQCMEFTKFQCCQSRMESKTNWKSEHIMWQTFTKMFKNVLKTTSNEVK